MGFKTIFRRLGENSASTMAQDRPRGTPMTMAPRVTRTEEMIMARMPKWPLVGAQWLEQDEVLQPGREDEGKAFQKDEDGDEGQGADGRQGQEQQHPFDEFLPVHYFTPTRPSFSRICWPVGAQDEVHEVLGRSRWGLPGLTSRKRRRNL